MEENSTILKGCRIYKVIRYSPYFTKFIAKYNGELIIIIYKHYLEKNDICIGDYVKTKGKHQVFNNSIEIKADEIEVIEICQITKAKDFDKKEMRKKQLLTCRMLACKKINEILFENEFLPFQSPTITSNWVEGRTTPFKTNFHGVSAYLSISNMLYHQIALSNGMNKIFELGKVHRQEIAGNKHKLSEFTILDISKSFSSIKEIMIIFEKVIISVWNMLSNLNLYRQKLIDDVRFEKISYTQLLKESGVDEFSGSQLPWQCRKYLDENYSSFVWVYDFDITKRPFYTKRENGNTSDVQLWYRGKEYFAAGSEIETNYSKIKERILAQGKNLYNYDYYLECVKKGMPPMAMVGMGVEKLLTHLLIDTKTYEYAYFPRYKGSTFF